MSTSTKIVTATATATEFKRKQEQALGHKTVTVILISAVSGLPSAVIEIKTHAP